MAAILDPYRADSMESRWAEVQPVRLSMLPKPIIIVSEGFEYLSLWRYLEVVITACAKPVPGFQQVILSDRS